MLYHYHSLTALARSPSSLSLVTLARSAPAQPFLEPSPCALPPRL